MSKTKRQTYLVGRGKPPQAAKFKKGTSGNPGGRPRGSKNFSTQYMAEVNATIPAMENGKPVKISKLTANIKHEVAQGATGNLRAIDKVLSRVAGFEASQDDSPDYSALFTDADREVLATILSKLTTP